MPEVLCTDLGSRLGPIPQRAGYGRARQEAAVERLVIAACWFLPAHAAILRAEQLRYRPKSATNQWVRGEGTRPI